ncbi:hypothetical protein BDP81DRAFT_186997 [Colletotrichum phormii]|uniref:Uncharacterized protein n=1 Tax=Colletotrichum phormii TaxID=359342 RepID=A0AAJ0E797_9PEZI|nr:uncharacterized protein BDP81DRAFT_186997 [Colletotrichum phormii]KAK1621494.1 hypothetical protein BDP81DRAFT_186997 [Colletotrichum phormii]
MRFSAIAFLTAIMAVASAASPVEAEKRQLSACVQQCMDDLGIYDGHAISQCRRTCGERP